MTKAQKELERQARRINPWEFHSKVMHKPLSINAAYYRNKKKTIAYKDYEIAWGKVLNGNVMEIDEDEFVKKDMLFRVDYKWGFSNNAADVDNPIKTTTDIMQNFFLFNDKQIRIIKATKTLVSKGEEFAEVWIKEVFTEDLT